jgi:hypothetical protein
MIALIEIDRWVDTPEKLVGFLGVLALCCSGVWLLVRWLFRGPIQPDPWSDEIAAELKAEEAAPLCHRCLCPHGASADFCPECGAPVGTYTNWLPFPYLFSIGHMLRIGTAGEFRHSPLTIIGFFLFGLVEYALFAPVYWFVFFRSLLHRAPAGPPAEANSPSTPA